MFVLAEASDGHTTQPLPFIYNNIDSPFDYSYMDHHTFTYPSANRRAMRTPHELVISSHERNRV